MPRKLTGQRSQRLVGRRKLFSQARSRSILQRRRYRRSGRPSCVRWRFFLRLGAINSNPRSCRNRSSSGSLS